MKTFGAFAINPESGNRETDEEKFVGELSLLNGEPGYKYPHFFEDGRISSYGSYVIVREGTDNLEAMRKSYGIYPTVAYKLKGGSDCVHLVFEMPVGVSREEYLKVSSVLEFIYSGVSSDFHFYGGNPNFVDTVISDGPEFSQSKNLINLSVILDEKGIERELTKDEMGEIAKINALDISEVAADLGKPDDEPIDTVNNVSPKWGRVYDFVLNSFNTASQAKTWMNENYGTAFVARTSVSAYGLYGEKIVEGKDFYLDDAGYYAVRGNDKVRQTDFFVNVHYKIVKPNETTFVVSLVNGLSGDKSAKFEWPNVVNRASLSEILQKLGNFHFTGGQQFVSSFHAKLSEFDDVPEIKAILGYGFHRELGIMVLENGVFDLKQKIFTEKTVMDDNFLFNYDGKGYLVIDKHGSNLSPIMKGLIPRINSPKLVETDDAFSFLNKLYADHSGKLLLMTYFGNMGYSAFSNVEDVTNRYPVFFVRGLTGSGKTTYVDVMQRMWGLREASRSFQQTSNFTISILISYLRHVPMFLSEFRDAGGSDVKTKGATIRSMFDGTGQAKGRPDQTIINYDYKSTMVIEGEEMFTDPALRTRCVQHQFLSSHKIKGDFSKIFKEGRDILDGLTYTYLNLATKERYDEAMEEGYVLFKNASGSSRICNNLRMMYAGCMAIDPKRRDEYVEILTRVGKFQDTDYRNNSGGMQILKAMARFIEQASGFDEIYISSDSVIISWGAFEEYVKMKRVDLSLNVETYKEHLSEMGFQVDFHELHDKMVYGVIIPKKEIPKEFLVNPTVYEAWKQGKKNP